MEQAQLLENEEVITQSSGGEVTLTTHRIRYSTSGWGHAQITSIMLENISSVQSHFRSLPLLLVLGIIALAAGVLFSLNNVDEGALTGFGVGALLLVLYFVSRKHVVTVSSNGGAAISFLAKGMGQYEITKFIDQVEGAKNSKRLVMI